MSGCSAFLTPRPYCCSFSPTVESSFTCSRQLTSTPTTLRAVPRRQRLRATATPPKPDDPGEGEKSKEEQPQSGETGEGDPTEDVANSEDVELSDLTLPNLRELFAGSGKPGCEQCDGKGEIPCPVCDAKGFISLTMMDTTSSTQCRMCRGQRIVPCPTCREMVYKSVLWWDQIPSKDEDPNDDWRQGPDGPRIPWGDPPAGP